MAKQVLLKYRTGAITTTFVTAEPVSYRTMESQATYPTQSNDFSMDM